MPRTQNTCPECGGTMLDDYDPDQGFFRQCPDCAYSEPLGPPATPPED